LAATACAWLICAASDPYLSDHALYVTFMGAAMITGVVSGWRNAALSALLGAGLTNTFIAEGSAEVIGALAVYLLVCGYMIYLIQGLTSSLRREIKLSETLDTVSREYRHRIQNLLAVSQAVVHQSGRGAASVGEFKEKVLGRLQAMSRAQDLLLDRGDSTAPLRTVLSESLRPFDIEARLVRPLAGPEVSLASDTAVALALLVNELATNSTKYGALSVPEGRVQLGWSVHQNGAEMEWKESGGPAVAQPTRRGFGSQLVERVLPGASGAQLLFEPDGVRCKINLEAATPPAAGASGLSGAI
jgi:two-component sensor histidine kinase